jgi:hypothetical protein
LFPLSAALLACHMIGEALVGAFTTAADGQVVVKGGDLDACPKTAPNLKDLTAILPKAGCQDLLAFKLLPLVD